MDRQKLLIVDDEPLVISTLSRYLSGMPYEVLTARNGLEGLEILQQQKVCLAFIDVQMPKMDGLTLLCEAKKQKIKTVIVIMTGFGSMEVGVQAIKSGAVDAIQKPVLLNDFLSMVEEYLPSVNGWKSCLETFLEQNYKNPALCLDDLMRYFRFSKTTGWRLFKSHLGEPFRKRLTRVRLDHAERLILESSLSITEISHLCGFSSLERLCESFKKKHGCTPLEFRKRGTLA